MRRKNILWLVWLFFLPALACNFPGLGRNAPGGISGEHLRQTLAAQDTTVTPIQATTSPATPSQAPPSQATQSADVTPAPTSPPPAGTYYDYTVNSGDTPAALAGRFGVELAEIPLPPGAAAENFLEPGLKLSIPNRLSETTSARQLLPDSELVYSSGSAGFDLPGYIQEAGGYLSAYHEVVDQEDLNGAQIVQRVADELSVNPRLLLAILEFRSRWVSGQPADQRAVDHPIGFYVPNRSGLYQEIMITATQLNVAYYGWRQGTFTSIKYNQGVSQRVDPTLNPASAAVQHLFALLNRQGDWTEALYGQENFTGLYQQMFGDAWGRAASIGPLFPPGLAQPSMELPFVPGERWSLTAGPHPSWNAGTPRGALDFSPVTGEAVCAISRAWVTAPGAGMVVRSSDHALALDLDGDGYEQTGWVIFFYHLAGEGIPAAGSTVNLDTPLGHPSCEGGRATGKHVHIARKYNGEWVAADGPLPFTLSGWRAHADERNYYGTLERDGQIVTASPVGPQTSIIVR